MARLECHNVTHHNKFLSSFLLSAQLQAARPRNQAISNHQGAFIFHHLILIILLPS
jgi:hypothetical protein